jgi:hypothetical protein
LYIPPVYRDQCRKDAFELITFLQSSGIISEGDVTPLLKIVRKSNDDSLYSIIHLLEDYQTKRDQITDCTFSKMKNSFFRGAVVGVIEPTISIYESQTKKHKTESGLTSHQIVSQVFGKTIRVIKQGLYCVIDRYNELLNAELLC